MTDKIQEVAKEINSINKGILISAIVIFGGLVPQIEIAGVKIIPVDSILLILAGFSSLFYFISIRINQNEYQENGITRIETPAFKSRLSKEMCGISIFILILFILRGGYLFIKSFI